MGRPKGMPLTQEHKSKIKRARMIEVKLLELARAMVHAVGQREKDNFYMKIERVVLNEEKRQKGRY